MGIELVSTVSISEGVRYGFNLIIYILVIGIATGLGVLVGGALVSVDNVVVTLVGAFLALASVLGFYAGMMGILYKVIADGVAVGVTAANEPSAPTGRDPDAAERR